MKTSTLLMLAGGAAALYYLSKKAAADAGQTTQGVQSPPFVAPSVAAQMAVPQVIVVDSDDESDANYGAWGWSSPAFGARAWRAGSRPGTRGGHGHGGHR